MIDQPRRVWPEVVGLIPAAGQAKRLQPFPCSKELFPVGFAKDPQTGMPRPKVAAQYLLEKFKAAGISKTFIVIREGKWDIPNYFQEGQGVGLSLAYLVIPGSAGPPDTLDRAYPFIAQNRIAFGFPDILFGPADAYRQLVEQQERTEADVVLGLHRIEETRAWDMVDSDTDGWVRAIVMKPASTTLTFGWCFAVWTPAFTEFLHQFLRANETMRNMNVLASTANDPGGDLAVGVVFQAALKAGLRMQAVKFPQDSYLDIGTPENLAKAVRREVTE
ncbi:MAG: sugar phosphate nucleotidyltransferase [Nitrospira sp.]|nr:sugar phosphate nucleotidyltransferase [Nitrospira sp.]MDH4368912.1 sugar phosphate nucleotidyltransferase [Nitrospira sp.]MDH5347338.1 sugar phosphate nucleotidyltransferase [Nitrospira sp.]MDH5496767.1 sugar phosphate nucleotidyltransferase [Nitrospira sp.]